MPTELAEGGFIPQVAGLVSLDLCPPPLAAGFRNAEVRAMLMAVPEAAVDEDDVKKCPVVAIGYAEQAE